MKKTQDINPFPTYTILNTTVTLNGGVHLPHWYLAKLKETCQLLA